ncbi:heavy metal-binding domain-containing protein [Shewanella dokdonensis]|uniref:heavy metal-binding domain-containing protein n=1 Tax=Shewanella dokdonensis TaxID=712036 RepID=UPI001FD4F9FA|nr:heavy metal-binding domain-containing protein [Shewanella dokdonensis]MCL1074452.1 hypothetical protein [Shewanella dokdonensis]
MKSLTTLLFIAFLGLGLTGYSYAAEPATQQHKQAATEVYHCPMHPEETGHKGDSCPICGMKMVPADNQGKNTMKNMPMQGKPATNTNKTQHDMHDMSNMNMHQH